MSILIFGAALRPIYLFEFCDQSWVPSGARECLFEIMDACNSGLRSFNREVARSAIQTARDHQLATIIELGAGRGPVTSELTQHEDADGMRLVACDLAPNIAAFERLEQKFPNQVFPIYMPVDLTKTQVALNDAVLILAGVMHHIPFHLRVAVLRTLTETNSQIAIFEPLLRTWRSIFLATLSIFPALLLPVTFFQRPGKLRRILWCWLIPIVPFMFVWDGVVSCLRQWHIGEWQAAFAELPNPPNVRFQSGFNSLRMVWSGRANRVSSSESSAPVGAI